jgi:hypothetical protein
MINGLYIGMCNVNTSPSSEGFTLVDQSDGNATHAPALVRVNSCQTFTLSPQLDLANGDSFAQVAVSVP